MSHILLSAQKITRRFGGLTAIDKVSIHLQLGKIHSVIGTNGAGKSTLIAILAGELPPNEGDIFIGSQNVTTWSQPKRARSGLGRSYQRTTIFPTLSVHENCRLAAQANNQKFWSLANASQCKKSCEAADLALEQTNLLSERKRIAGLLSHGGKRQLEIAMSLATNPSILLLDEPLAGMGPEESEGMLALLTSLKKEQAIMLVEHDMDAVFKVSDLITVMVNGCVIAHGSPGAIRQNIEVQNAYLGEN